MIISDDCKQTQVGGLQSYHFHVHLDGCGAFIRSSAARRAASASSFFRCLSKSLQRKPNFGQVSISIRHTPLHLFSLVRLASAIYGLLHPPGHVRVNPKCSSAKRNRSALPSSHAAQPVVPNDLCFGGFRWSASRKKVIASKPSLADLPSCRLVCVLSQVRSLSEVGPTTGTAFAQVIEHPGSPPDSKSSRQSGLKTVPYLVKQCQRMQKTTCVWTECLLDIHVVLQVSERR